jgi:hypothetical protein
MAYIVGQLKACDFAEYGISRSLRSILNQIAPEIKNDFD